MPVPDPTTTRPIMALLDLLGRKWALRVIWELRDDDAMTFRALQDRCGGISSSVLSQRVTDLRGAGILEDAEGGYRLTAEGRELLAAYGPLSSWAERWATRCARGSAAAR